MARPKQAGLSDNICCASPKIITTLRWALVEQMNNPCNLKAKEVSIELYRWFKWPVRDQPLECYQHSTDGKTEQPPVSLESDTLKRWMDLVKSSDSPKKDIVIQDGKNFWSQSVVINMLYTSMQMKMWILGQLFMHFCDSNKYSRQR